MLWSHWNRIVLQGPTTFYIGETASLHQRLGQHRRKYAGYECFRVLVLLTDSLPAGMVQLGGAAAAGRSRAQLVETMLITQLKAAHGVDICNAGADEYRVSF